MSTPTPTAAPLDPAYVAESRQPLFYGIVFGLLTCSTIVVSLRFYCRALIIRKIGLDDWLILVGLVFAWIFGIYNHFHVAYGIGKHIDVFVSYEVRSGDIMIDQQKLESFGYV
ncbi:hypothetical protein TWF281_011353 [Arthrobotrys megalospora]